MKGQRRNPNNNNMSDAKDQDRFLPIANVGRIMKKSLPPNAKISKEAKETVQECVSEFISFVTGEASDKCQREKRKTVNGDDILWAMTTLGFESYVGPLKAYLNKYRESEEGEKVNCNVADDRDDDHCQNFDEKDCFQFMSASGDYDHQHQVIVGKSFEFEYGNGKKTSSPLPANLQHGSSLEW